MAPRDWLERRAGGPAELYDGVVGRLDRAGLAGARQRLVHDVQGNVLELGCGTGGGFVHYAAGTRVTALEPEPDFRRAAVDRARAAAATITVLPGDAHDLPFPDATFDAAVAELMLCSVNRPDVALAEMRRVVRPGGALRLLEHVRHPRAWIGRLQDVVDPFWTALEGRGCHLGRDTPRVVEEAGFAVEAIDTVPMPPGVDWLFPIVTVRARRP